MVRSRPQHLHMCADLWTERGERHACTIMACPARAQCHPALTITLQASWAQQYSFHLGIRSWVLWTQCASGECLNVQSPVVCTMPQPRVEGTVAVRPEAAPWLYSFASDACTFLCRSADPIKLICPHAFSACSQFAGTMELAAMGPANFVFSFSIYIFQVANMIPLLCRYVLCAWINTHHGIIRRSDPRCVWAASNAAGTCS